MKYLAIDILTLAGVEKPEEKIGHFSVSIGGVSVNESNKIINIIGDSVEVLVANSEYEFTVPETQDESSAENVRVERERLGEIVTQVSLDRESAKADEETIEEIEEV